MVSALLGAALVPLAFVTCQSLNFSMSSSLFVAALVLFDTALTLQFRLILLDASLTCFIAFTICFWIRFRSRRGEPFSTIWYLDLFLTGVGLGLSVSVKFVGLSVIAWVGLGTVSDLWELLCDRTVGFLLFARHFAARAVCLVVVPLVLFLYFFHIHFSILDHSGPGNAMMSREFQRTLIGNTVSSGTLIDVGLGSTVMLKHVNSQGGYLHSHKQHYPAGSKRQQITACTFADDNSLWVIERDSSALTESSTMQLLVDGTVVRMVHHTGAYLRADSIDAPVTTGHREVSGQANGNTEELDFKWEVRVLSHRGTVEPESANRVQTFRTLFQLVNLQHHCALSSHDGTKLPNWGFEQQEITCDPDFSKSLSSGSVWVVDSNSNPLAPADAPSMPPVPMPFWAKLKELVVTMFATNQGFTGTHPYQSHASDWPFAVRGVNYWVYPGKAIYFIANPLVWWTASGSLFVLAAVAVVIALRSKRGYPDRASPHVQAFEYAGLTLSFAYALHYVPFFLMKRQLFLHHYLPAAYISMLVAGALFEFFFGRLPRKIRIGVLLLALAALYWSHRQFLPFVQGLEMTGEHCQSLKWRLSWDFDCPR